MSEIEKMYENAGIKPKQKGHCNWGNYCPYPYSKCNDECPWWKYKDEVKYPPFTAEKQISILIALVNYNLYEEDKRLMIDSFNGEIYIGFYQDIDLKANATDKEFSECVAKLINNIWQDLTEQEKTEIVEILKG